MTVREIVGDKRADANEMDDRTSGMFPDPRMSHDTSPHPEINGPPSTTHEPYHPHALSSLKTMPSPLSSQPASLPARPSILDSADNVLLSAYTVLRVQHSSLVVEDW